MNAKELNEILRLHWLWLNNEPGGRQASLHKANLRYANLSYTDLRKAALSDSDLIGAYLVGADLSYSDLSGADLRGVDLSDTYLRGADLRVAKLHNAELPYGCKYYWGLPKHEITIIHDVAHIGCRSMPLEEWCKRGPEIGEESGYTPEQIAIYMEILKKHER
jgi:hypothetical protein